MESKYVWRRNLLHAFGDPDGKRNFWWPQKYTRKKQNFKFTTGRKKKQKPQFPFFPKTTTRRKKLPGMGPSNRRKLNLNLCFVRKFEELENRIPASAFLHNLTGCKNSEVRLWNDIFFQGYSGRLHDFDTKDNPMNWYPVSCMGPK